MFEKIRQWAYDRGITILGNPKDQVVKLMEEVGELARGILKNDERLVVDSIGDCVVVLTILAMQRGYTIESCIESAYEEIKSRKGEMKNGVFIKEEHK